MERDLVELRDTLLFFGVDYGMVQSRNGIFLGQSQVGRVYVYTCHTRLT